MDIDATSHNTLLKTLTSLPLSLNQCKQRHSHQPIESLTPLTAAEYTVSGGTPLYDAIGTACEVFDRFKGVVMVIVTDGEENTSKRFTLQQVKQLLKRKKEECDWEFIYLCADEAGFAAGNAMGVNHNIQVAQSAMSAAMRSAPPPDYYASASSILAETAAAGPGTTYVMSSADQPQTVSATVMQARISRSPQKPATHP